MPSNLDTLRRVHALALRSSILGPVDLDLAAEAGMDGNLARLLQAARDLDAVESNMPPGSTVFGVGAPSRWFGFTLAFGDEGADIDTVRAVLGLRSGWLVHVEPHGGEALDVVFTDVEQEDGYADGWPVYLVGNRYNENHTADNEYRGEPVRVALAGARVTVY